MKIAPSVKELIGGTPLVRLNRVVGDCGATILGKLEAANPGNSVKDRIGLAMIEAAEKAGDLVPGRSTIVEPTSGNTGIALSFVAAVKGYPCVIVMPDTMSPERRATMRAFGAKIVLTEGAKGMRGAVERARGAGADGCADLHAGRRHEQSADDRILGQADCAAALAAGPLDIVERAALGLTRCEGQFRRIDAHGKSGERVVGHRDLRWCGAIAGADLYGAVGGERELVGLSGVRAARGEQAERQSE